MCTLFGMAMSYNSCKTHQTLLLFHWKSRFSWFPCFMMLGKLQSGRNQFKCLHMHFDCGLQRTPCMVWRCFCSNRGANRKPKSNSDGTPELRTPWNLQNMNKGMKGGTCEENPNRIVRVYKYVLFIEREREIIFFSEVWNQISTKPIFKACNLYDRHESSNSK